MGPRQRSVTVFQFCGTRRCCLITENTDVCLCWIQKEPKWVHVLVTFLVGLSWGEALTWGPWSGSQGQSPSSCGAFRLCRMCSAFIIPLTLFSFPHSPGSQNLGSLSRLGSKLSPFVRDQLTASVTQLGEAGPPVVRALDLLMVSQSWFSCGK